MEGIFSCASWICSSFFWLFRIPSWIYSAGLIYHVKFSFSFSYSGYSNLGFQLLLSEVKTGHPKGKTSLYSVIYPVLLKRKYIRILECLYFLKILTSAIFSSLFHLCLWFLILGNRNLTEVLPCYIVKLTCHLPRRKISHYSTSLSKCFSITLVIFFLLPRRSQHIHQAQVELHPCPEQSCGLVM